MDNLKFHPLSENIVTALMAKAQNNERQFFRMQVAYFIGTVAAQMHVHIQGWGSDKIPVNMYTLNLAPSGAGKGMSTGVLKGMLKPFYENFFDTTVPIVSDKTLTAEAAKRSGNKGTSEEDERARLDKEYAELGAIPVAFDSVGSAAAIKQLRHKIQMTSLGSINLQIDEIGANLVGQTEALNTFIELYDLGIVLDKLIKSNKENLRTQKIDRNTPANMLLFGVPQKLFDGSNTEKEFYSMLSMGYARRCFFGLVDNVNQTTEQLTAEQLLEQMFNEDNDLLIAKTANDFARLADVAWANAIIKIEKPQCLKLIEYKMHCKVRANALPPHKDVEISEMEHRYFKVLKLAGAYAFTDFSPIITNDHLDYAIALAEDSGEAFSRIINPKRPYVRLAEYLMHSGTESTMSDLEEALPFMRGSQNHRNELIMMAGSWGIKNGILLSKAYVDNILFLSAKSIPETDLDKIICSYSFSETQGYNSKVMKAKHFAQLLKMPEKKEGTPAAYMHWLNHHVSDGYRSDSNIIPNFNMLVFDIDGTASIQFVQQIFKDYEYIIGTTKSHTETVHRFRLIFFSNYILSLNTEDYRSFMNSIMESLPIVVDDASNQRVKKWLTNPLGDVYVNHGKLFDVLPFIPKTAKNDEHKSTMLEQTNLDNLERWVLNNTGDGNRNKQLFKYAMILRDAGKSFDDIRNAVIVLNDKLKDKLPESELYTTVFYSLSKSMGV